jgi:transposase
LSDYSEWDKLSHAEECVISPQNIGESLSIDETSLSQDELYTIVTNKAAKGSKGCMVAMIKGNYSDMVKSILLKKIPTGKEG